MRKYTNNLLLTQKRTLLAIGFWLLFVTITSSCKPIPTPTPVMTTDTVLLPSNTPDLLTDLTVVISEPASTRQAADIKHATRNAPLATVSAAVAVETPSETSIVVEFTVDSAEISIATPQPTPASTPIQSPSSTLAVTPQPFVTDVALNPTEIAPQFTNGNANLFDEGRLIFQNANYVNAMIEYGGNLWLATAAGVVRWDRAAETYRIYNVGDGLLHNESLTITVCDNNRPTLFVGSIQGLSTFDLMWVSPIIMRKYTVERNL